MGKGSQAPDLSSSQINSAMAGFQSSQPQSLGISTGMDAIPSMNSQWAGKNAGGGGGGWQTPGQMMPTQTYTSGGFQAPTPWNAPPTAGADTGSTGASAALNILNSTQAGTPPSSLSAPMQGQQRPNWGMQRRQGGWNQPMRQPNSGGLQVSIDSFPTESQGTNTP